MNPSHNLLLCSEKQAHLSRVDICVTLTNTFSPSRKLNRNASGNEHAAWVHSLSGDSRGMVVMSKVSNVLKPMLSLTLWRWTCQTERTGCSCQLTRALSPWRVLPPDSQVLSPCRQPLWLTPSIFRFVNTTQKAPARLCCLPGPGLEGILPSGCPTQTLGVWVGLLSFNLLVLRFGFGSIWEIWKIPVPGSLSPKF